MFKLAKYLKGYRAKTIIGPFFKLFEAFFELITPLVVAWVIDTAIPREDRVILRDCGSAAA